MAGFHPSMTVEELVRLDKPKRTMWQILSHDGEYSFWLVALMVLNSLWAFLVDRDYRQMVRKVWRDA